MISTACQSCAAPLVEPESGTVARCPICGAPQVRLSEELRDSAAAERERYEADRDLGVSISRPGGAMDWKRAITWAAIASFAAVLVCALLPSLSVLAWMLPIPVFFLYRRSSPSTVLTPLAGARFGAITGVFVSAGAAVVGVVYLLVRRFVLHNLGGFDAMYSEALGAAIRQAAAQTGAQTGNIAAPSAAAQAAMFAAPEFRAGLLLALLFAAAVSFVALSVLSGLLAALLQSRRVSTTPA